ncbi:poly-beta-1,6 N-acetyl-D-glucosamine export porin PgaA [Rhodoferax koreensis]|nr:poly-beta-1,6 N-acetyl-D-glucosamine export porin PgaA [Rhodoferax koreense]
MQQPYSKLFLALTVAFTVYASPAQAVPSGYQQAVTDARAGRFDSALPVLEKLALENPGQSAYRYDLVAVLSWAGHHALAVAESRDLKLSSQIPDYVLAAIGKSALDAGPASRAEEAYRLLARRQPRKADANLGLALALLAQHQTAEADIQLARVLRLSVNNPALLQSASAALVARDEAGRASPFQQQLNRLGITETSAATVHAPAPPPTVANAAPAGHDEPAAVAVRALAASQASNGQQIREAENLLDTDFTLARYRLIDAALLANGELIEQARTMPQREARDVLERLRFDRVVALKDRKRADEALAQFTALEAEGEIPPPYVVNAAADAAMQLRQPERARDLYQRALASDPANIVTQTALMYAHVEAEDFSAAESIVGNMLEQTRQSAAVRRTDATLTRFADRIDTADRKIRQLAGELPDDAGIWLAQADLLAQRGLPRAAAARYNDVLAVAPDNIAARVGLADATWAQGDIIEAGRMIAALRSAAPEHPAVQRILRAWERRERPFLTSTATKGFGQGAVSGNDDLVWETTVYSGQTGNGIRIFGNHHLANAKFNGESASHERTGAGIEWTRRDLQATLEVGHDLRNGRDNTWAASAGWQVNDQLSFRARHESETNDFPLKGRLASAENWAPTYLHASKTLVGMAYRWNEARRVAADLAYYDFNDGNKRQALSVAWFERLYSGYGRTLDLQTAAYSSTNTAQDAIYFNPKRDTAVSATLAGDWQTWRRYDRAFNQRVSLTVGSYLQHSNVRQDDAWAERTYGWNMFEDARYEHEWQFGPDRSTRYGVGVRRFPYDGKYETKSYIYLNLNWRF